MSIAPWDRGGTHAPRKTICGPTVVATTQLLTIVTRQQEAEIRTFMTTPIVDSGPGSLGVPRAYRD